MTQVSSSIPAASPTSTRLNHWSSPMKTPNSSFRPGYFTQLVTHLHEFDDGERRRIADRYDAPSEDATSLAEFWIRHPDRVVEVTRRELTSSVGWRIVEEAVVDHDLMVSLAWASVRGRRAVERLGLLRPQVDEAGRSFGVMPGALAAIFADRVRGRRGSLPLMLGRRDPKENRQLAETWELATDGSPVEVILRICDHFGRHQMIDDVLERLPDPDWVGDALMVLELGGMCHWQGVYGFDVDNGDGPADNVVPLMRNSERKQQRDVADRLQELGVLFRLEDEAEKETMIAVPEALWPGLWRLGRRWLMDWAVQAMVGLRDSSHDGEVESPPAELRGVLKWWICEGVAGDGLQVAGDDEGLTEASVRRLDRGFDAELRFDWDDARRLGEELRILERTPGNKLIDGREAETLLDEPDEDFAREVLLEWALGYSGARADRKLVDAIGLDETWRSRSLALMRRHGEPIPAWMHQPGVEPKVTGGGWLRQSGTGDDEMVLFESGLVATFAVMTKVLWLDLVSLLDTGRCYPVDGLVALMQNVAGLSMFGQLRLVLEEQPAPIYLPFQRASFLMDQRQQAPFRNWVRDVIEGLLVPLGVAVEVDDGEFAAFATDSLRVADPPGWPPGRRRELLDEIFGRETDFDLDNGGGPGLREVAPPPGEAGEVVSVAEPVSRLVEMARGRDIVGFDGESIEFGARRGDG